MNRLTEAPEGTYSAGSISSGTRGEYWLLSQTGNWKTFGRDLTGDADFNDSEEINDAREHNQVNEITSRNLDSAGGAEFTPGYNKRGDLVNENGTGGYKYEYDAFGRLRIVRNQSNNAVAEYTYDGLGRRVGWHYDVDADGTLENNSDDPWYYFAYDSKWRIVATFRGSDTSPKELYAHHMAGQGGNGSANDIDTVAFVDRDVTKRGGGWEGAADGTLEKRYYPMQNWRADVVAVADAMGARLESIRYTSCGLPWVQSDADYNHDGYVDGADADDFSNDFGNAELSSDANWNGEKDEGDIETMEQLIAVAENSGLFGKDYGDRGTLSLYGLRKGYAGYEHDGIIAKLWHVRNRVLDSELGRWTRRDPAGYVDGMSLHAYTGSNPVSHQDPNGLFTRIVIGLNPAVVSPRSQFDATVTQHVPINETPIPTATSHPMRHRQLIPHRGRLPMSIMIEYGHCQRHVVTAGLQTPRMSSVSNAAQIICLACCTHAKDYNGNIPILWQSAMTRSIGG